MKYCIFINKNLKVQIIYLMNKLTLKPHFFAETPAANTIWTGRHFDYLGLWLGLMMTVWLAEIVSHLCFLKSLIKHLIAKNIKEQLRFILLVWCWFNGSNVSFILPGHLVPLYLNIWVFKCFDYLWVSEV